MTYRTRIQDGQIALPRRLLQLAGLADGAPLDVTFGQGEIVVATPGAPKSRAEFMQRLRSAAAEALKKIWAESERKEMQKNARREVNSGIARPREKRRRQAHALHV